MKATGIVRRVDDLGRIVIPKEIRRTLRIREGDPSYTTLTLIDRFCWAIYSVHNKIRKNNKILTTNHGRGYNEYRLIAIKLRGTLHMGKKKASIIGIVLGIAIIIIGFCVQGISVDAGGADVGSSYMQFGADFYTEIYDVTRDVGIAVNRAQTNICGAVESVCDAIGWLIIVIGLFDIAYFVCKMASCGDNYSGNNYNAAPTTASTYTTQSQATPTSYSAPSIIEPASTANVDEWKCTCGKIHKNYEMSCACGVTKAEAKMKNNQNN